MSEMATEHPAVDDLPAADDLDIPVAFNEPRFVTWWLGTLYLFKPGDQVAIAQLLQDAVHSPAVTREIQAFIEFHALEAGLSADVESAPPPVASSDEEVLGGVPLIKSRLAELWRSSPWMVGLGVAAIVFFIAKGAWFVVREFFRIVF